jgi:L-rhamnose mutarotase
MPLIHKISNGFDFCSNLEAKSHKSIVDPYGKTITYDPFKLHLAVPYETHFNVVKTDVNALLREAVENFVIRAYKVVNYSLQTMPLYTREKYVPYTLYLHAKYSADNAAQVLRLCKKIDRMLTERGVPMPQPSLCSYLSECGVGKYFFFRATNTSKNMMDKVFKYIEGEDVAAAAELKETGLQSKYYKYLQPALAVAEDKEDATETLTMTSEEKRDEVTLRFSNGRFFLSAPAQQSQRDCVTEAPSFVKS